MFKRSKFKVVTQAELTELGDDYVEARGWDFAATEETPGKDPDYTVGSKVRRYSRENSSLSDARLMPYCCRGVPPSPPLQIPGDGPAFGGRAGRVVRDHAGGFPVAGQHDFRGGRAARRQFGREPDPATVRRQARLDTSGEGGGGEPALNL